MIRIPFLDLTREYKKHQKKLILAINGVLASGRFLRGHQVELFEKEFGVFLGVSKVIATGSGTDAIILALQALGIKPGDKVILPANACHSIFGIIHTGAIPVLVDIDKDTLNLDPDKLSKMKFPEDTKAILFVHMYGNPSGVLETLKFARKHNLFLVEDCAQAHGAEINNLMAGSIADISAFSFYPTKNLGAFSDGGAVATNSKKFAERVRYLSNNGERERFVIEEIGLTSNLDEIQAAILRIKLRYLRRYNIIRQHIFKLYQKHLSGLPLILPFSNIGTKHVYHLFPVRTKKRNQLYQYLKNRGIGADIHYPIPLHLQPSMRFLGYKKGDFPNAEMACQTVLSLPMYPFLTKAEVETICYLIHQFFLASRNS